MRLPTYRQQIRQAKRGYYLMVLIWDEMSILISRSSIIFARIFDNDHHGLYGVPRTRGRRFSIWWNQYNQHLSELEPATEKALRQARSYLKEIGAQRIN